MGYANIYAYFTYRHRSRAVEIAAGECWPCPSAGFARCCRNPSAPCSASAGTAAPPRWGSSCPTGCCGCPPAAARASPAPCSACSCSRKARLEKLRFVGGIILHLRVDYVFGRFFGDQSHFSQVLALIVSTSFCGQNFNFILDFSWSCEKYSKIKCELKNFKWGPIFNLFL